MANLTIIRFIFAVQRATHFIYGKSIGGLLSEISPIQIPAALESELVDVHYTKSLNDTFVLK